MVYLLIIILAVFTISGCSSTQSGVTEPSPTLIYVPLHEECYSTDQILSYGLTSENDYCILAEPEDLINESESLEDAVLLEGYYYENPLYEEIGNVVAGSFVDFICTHGNERFTDTFFIDELGLNEYSHGNSLFSGLVEMTVGKKKDESFVYTDSESGYWEFSIISIRKVIPFSEELVTDEYVEANLSDIFPVHSRQDLLELAREGSCSVPIDADDLINRLIASSQFIISYNLYVKNFPYIKDQLENDAGMEQEALEEYCMKYYGTEHIDEVIKALSDEFIKTELLTEAMIKRYKITVDGYDLGIFLEENHEYEELSIHETVLLCAKEKAYESANKEYSF